MDTIEIWPSEEIDFGDGVLAGVPIVMIKFFDPEKRITVEVGFRHAQFVTFADHVQMVGDAVLKGGLTGP